MPKSLSAERVGVKDCVIFIIHQSLAYTGRNIKNGGGVQLSACDTPTVQFIFQRIRIMNPRTYVSLDHIQFI